MVYDVDARDVLKGGDDVPVALVDIPGGPGSVLLGGRAEADIVDLPVPRVLYVGEEGEVFLRKGRICEESICPKCGYKFEIQPEPVIVPREVPDKAE